MHLINFRQYRKVQNEKSPLFKVTIINSFLYILLDKLFCAYYILYLYSIYSDFYSEGSSCVYTVLCLSFHTKYVQESASSLQVCSSPQSVKVGASVRLSECAMLASPSILLLKGM